jgi:ribosomal protein L29
MFRFLTGLAVLSFGLVTMSSAGAADEQASPKRDPDALFKKLDANGDGKLTKEEFAKFTEQMKGKLGDRAEKLGKVFDGLFDRLDANKDNSLSLEEFKKIGGGLAGPGGFKGKFGNKNPEELKKKLEELRKNLGGGNAEEFKKKIQELKQNGNFDEIRKQIQDAIQNNGGNIEELKKKIEELRKKKAGEQ